MKKLVLLTLGMLAAGAASASIPPAYQKDLPPATRVENIEFMSGGVNHDEELALKRASQDFPLELVFDEHDELVSDSSDHTYEHPLSEIPVTIRDDHGKVVFDGVSRGPIFVARLPKGHYTVSAHWDAWSFEAPVTIGEDRQRLVFNWKRVAAS